MLVNREKPSKISLGLFHNAYDVRRLPLSDSGYLLRQVVLKDRGIKKIKIYEKSPVKGVQPDGKDNYIFLATY
jgi:hypothetical protein